LPIVLAHDHGSAVGRTGRELYAGTSSGSLKKRRSMTLPRNSLDALTMALASLNGKVKNISPIARSFKLMRIDHHQVII
jgi:hypothetical protein